MRLGLCAYFVGATTTPSIGAGDLLVIGSGSGTAGYLVCCAKRAKQASVSLATLTIFPGASIDAMADIVFTLPGATPQKEAGAADPAVSVRPMGSLFKQFSSLCYNAVVLELMERLGRTGENVFPTRGFGIEFCTYSHPLSHKLVARGDAMKGNTILRGALLLTGGNLFMRLCSMLFQVYLSREVGAAGLGLLQLISSVGMLAMSLGCSGVRIAAMYLPAEEYGLRRYFGVRRAVGCCLTYGLCTSVVAGIALLFSAGTLAQTLIGDARATSSLQIMALFLPFTCLCSVMAGYFTACAKIRQLVAIEIIEQLLSFLVTFLLLRLWAGQNAERACCAIVWGNSVGSVFDFFVMYAIYRRNQRPYPDPGEDLHMGSRLIRLCVPLALNDYLRTGLSTAEQLLIPYGLSQSGESYTASMAAYGTIHGMVFPLLMFPATILYSVSDLLVPELSRCRASKNQLRILRLTQRCLQLCLLFAGLLTGFFFSCAEPLGNLIYHSAEASRYIRLFAPLVVMLYLDAIVDGTLKGLAEQIACVRYNTLTSFLDVALLFVLLPRMGIGGYYFSFALTHLLNFCLSIGRLCKVTQFQIPFGQWCRVAGCVLAAAWLSQRLIPDGAAQWWILLVRGSCYAAVGLGLLWLTKKRQVPEKSLAAGA